MNIFLGSDHGGFGIKESLGVWLQGMVENTQGKSSFSVESVVDCGASSLTSDDDYPVFARLVARHIADAQESATAEPATWGILVCRSGGGMAIVANKFPHARAVVCRSRADVEHARAHNNANILVLEGDDVSEDEARAFVTQFFTTAFAGGRHTDRLAQIEAIEKELALRA